MKYENKNFALIDIGNSRIKILDGSFINSFELTPDVWAAKVEKTLSQYGTNSKIIISSVNAEALSILTQILESHKKRFLMVDKLLAKSKIIAFDKVQGMGNDRKLGLIGAFSIAEPPLAVVDCGTALTINFLNQKKVAIGGAILPGLTTQAKSLNNYTSQLPKVDLFFTGNYCGENTQSAIQAGIFAATAGGIKEVIGSVSKEHFRKNKVSLFITGGDSSKVSPLLNGMNYTLEPNLVLIGIKKLAEEHFSLNT